MKDGVRIWVDGDGCPVKETVIAIGASYLVEVIVVMSVAHFTPKQDQRAQWQFVDSAYQNVDMVILNQAHAGDIAVTQDYGLASLLLNKGLSVLHHSGFQYTKENIDQLLFRRYLTAKIRKAGGRTKGPKTFSDQERERFGDLLVRVINEALQE